MISPLLTKMIIMPFIIALVTFASRKWGNSFAGTLASLPWVAAPILYFIALEQGKQFAIDSIPGVMVGIIAWLLFCVTYIMVGMRYNAFVSLISGYIVYIGIGFVLTPVIPMISLNTWVLLSALVYILVLRYTPTPIPKKTHDAKPPKYDIPLRMVVVTVFVIVITYFAEILGSEWSGILTPSPVMTAVLAIFIHTSQGIYQVRKVFFGLFVGSPGFTLFLYLQVFLLPHLPILTSFLIGAGIEILAMLIMQVVFNKLKINKAA
jgi:hypothetical protein